MGSKKEKEIKLWSPEQKAFAKMLKDIDHLKSEVATLKSLSGFDQVGSLYFKLPMETESFEVAQDGWKYREVIRDIDNYLRGKEKYEDIGIISVNEAREKIFELLKNYEIEI